MALVDVFLAACLFLAVTAHPIPDPNILISISPVEFNPITTPKVDIDCKLGQSNAPSSIASIQIIKDGNSPVATLTSSAGLSVSMNKNNFRVTGNIDTTDVKNSYLKLEMTSPDLTDAGNFTCSVSYFDHHNIKQLRRSQKANLKSIDLSEVDLRTLVINLHKKINYKCYFSAYMQAQFNITYVVVKGKSPSIYFLKFDEVKENEGNAYNKATGIFTVPRTGLYSFTVSTYDQDCGRYILFMMARKPGATLGSDLLARQPASASNLQASITTVSHLQAGWDVYIVLNSVRTDTCMFSGYKNARFSGYLIAAD